MKRVRVLLPSPKRRGAEPATIEEFEEQTQTESEQRSAELREKYDRRAEEMTAQFSAQHDALLEALFAETLAEAER